MGFLDVVFIAAFLFFLFYTHKQTEKRIFNRETTGSLRGLSVLAIMLHHIHNRLGLDSAVLGQVGYLTTGLFFFISGYGNTLSLEKQTSRKAKWIVSKILKIYIPFIVVYCFYIISNCLFYPALVPTWPEMFKDVVIISLPNEITWFPKIIVLCFIVHWISNKISRSHGQLLLFACIMLCGYVVGTYYLGWEEYWYNSVLCYPFGMSVAMIAENAVQYFNTDGRKKIWLLSVAALFAVVFLITQHLPQLRIICAILFALGCYLFTTLFQTKTIVFSWMGNNSFEFFLIHIALIQTFECVLPAGVELYTACVVVSSFILVYVYSSVSAWSKRYCGYASKG